MARIFELSGRLEASALCRAAAAQLLDSSRAPARVAFARRLAERALEVASGRVSPDEVSRQPREAAVGDVRDPDAGRLLAGARDTPAGA
jgi:hypothetical protein